MSQPNFDTTSFAAPAQILVDSSVQNYLPGQSDARVLRDAMGKFATGVTIVAVNTADGPIGMTVNSFSSLSIDPPLIQWAVAKKAGRYHAFMQATEFTVNILRAEHAQMALDFCKDASAFNDEQWLADSKRPPLLNTALASFHCEQKSPYDGGDHSIVIGQVIEGAFSEGVPLIFFGGEFGYFSKHKN